MLLRNEDLRCLNFSDCFSTIIPAKHHRGTQEAIAVDFYMDKDFMTACAMRHENIFRCPVIAFAFFLLSLFQVHHGVHTSKVTHGGRHAGSQEAQDLNIPLTSSSKAAAGRTALCGWRPIILASSRQPWGMAGFWEKPFFLQRNTVSRSLDLLLTIFPWTESYYGPNNVEWVKTCDNVMKEVDEFDPPSEGPIQFVEEAAQSSKRKVPEAPRRPPALATRSNNSKNNGTLNNANVAAAIFTPPTPIQVPIISPARPASTPIEPIPLLRSSLLSERSNPQSKR
ncbi:hypothetical protein [Parasitella parasitica]|uniref:Ndc10 domain-containing protein n=1 Tax=Parasitella parasitica TaxID=35722 RepID=A0A0B7N9T7_9FUNG|nr:hypothetical protein [Parasitella parasitica]